jgi:hypothetical protein
MRTRLSCLGAVVLLTAAALACPNPAAAQGQELKKLNVLLVIDTASNLGPSVRADLETMHSLLKQLPKNKVEETVLQGADATPARVLDYFKRLQTGSDEAVLCYYSGHGATDPDQGHVLALKAGFLSRKRLREAMDAKQPGLSVLLTDCCSNEVKLPPVQAEVMEIRKDKPMRDLFLRARGVVDITAATNTPSWGDNIQGGVFTRSLYSAVMNSNWSELDADHDGFVSWQEFFPRLQRETEATFKAFAQDARKYGTPINQTAQTPEAFEIKTSVVAVVEPSPGPSPNPPPDPGPAPVRPTTYALGVRVTSNGGTGVRITAISPGSPAARNRLGVNDLILSADGKAVRTAEDLQAAFAASNGRVRLVIRDHRSDRSYRRKIVLAQSN